MFGPQWNDGGFGEFVEDFTRADNDKIDLRNSGLSFADLTIQDDEFLGFSGIITSTLGRVEVNGMGSQGNGPLVESDFLFGPEPKSARRSGPNKRVSREAGANGNQ